MQVGRIAMAAVAYFLGVFAVGFAVGIFGIVVLEPRLGRLNAFFVESAVTVIGMAAIALYVPRLVRFTATTGALAAMGIGALVLQLFTEVAFAGATRGNGVSELLVRFSSPEGRVYAALLVAFVLMPLIVVPRARA